MFKVQWFRPEHCPTNLNNSEQGPDCEFRKFSPEFALNVFSDHGVFFKKMIGWTAGHFASWRPVFKSAKEGDSDWGKEVRKGQIIARGLGASGEQAFGQRRL